MVRSKIIIKLSALVAVALFTGCTNNNDLKPQSYKYETYPKYPNYAIIKPSKEKEFSEENLASMIKNLEGCPYVWAEEGPYCFDCSGYIYYMFGKMGVDIPRTAREQIKKGIPVAFEDLKFGDLVFFDTTRGKTGKITHVGMYLKDGWFTHASSSHKQITYSNFNNDSYYRSRFVAARRYYEKKGDRYAILQPKMQNDFTHMIASNNDYKPVEVVASNYSSSNKKVDIGGEVAYEDLQRGTIADNYNIKEENIVIKSTEAINNAPIKATDLSIVKQPEVTTNIKKIAEAKEAKTDIKSEMAMELKSESTAVKKTAKIETKSSGARGGYYVQVGKFKSSPDKNFLNKIKSEGYAYTIMPISENGKLASKILIGPFKNNTEAHGKLNDVKESIIKEAFVTKVNS